ncbi:MAG: TonB-dependent receptor [Muribaculaceae bacterium]|nr:TonB-dependent receptor [Muribaculaceae bacterium]
MKKSAKIIIQLILIMCVMPSMADAQNIADRIHRLDEVTVSARRPMKDIGVQKTTFDSIALKENIALSMADVLTFNSSVFVKSYGRATLSTVAFRGTSPSHTQVTWNGMRINSPMLGMTDFSTIPSYFIDRATLLHGTSSVNEAGGGLGGAVRLGTLPDAPEGVHLQYVQGVGSFTTFDEFARFAYGSEHWHISTRAVCSSSKNDYKYINHDKKVNIYDEDKNIIGQYHPEERNRSGAYRDLHILQEVYYNTLKGDRFGVSAWYIDSNRELPMLTTDYGDERDFENRQREHTFRGVAQWDHIRSNWKVAAKGGYIHTNNAYDYRREVTADHWTTMTRSRSHINTIFGLAEAEYAIGGKWFLTANLSAHQQFVKSDDKSLTLSDGADIIIGYDKHRLEMSGSVSAKWQPIDRLGLSLVMREDIYGKKYAPLIPAFFIDGLLSRQGNIMLRGSISKNYRFPSLNDLYFMPGGNPALKNEHGFSYDAGISFDAARKGLFSISGSATWFDSRINDWIIWLPTTKGFYSPRNMSKVHAYGVELKSNLTLRPFREWLLDLNGSYSWTPSINVGEKMSAADQSVGKQLPYVPKHSASVTGRLTWRTWSFLYKWAYYSQRFTMSSNDLTLSGHLPAYYMSNISLEKSLRLKPADLQLKLAVNNLFNEEYLSVLSRPMPGINFELFIGITPRIGKQKKESSQPY